MDRQACENQVNAQKKGFFLTLSCTKTTQRAGVCWQTFFYPIEHQLPALCCAKNFQREGDRFFTTLHFKDTWYFKDIVPIKKVPALGDPSDCYVTMHQDHIQACSSGGDNFPHMWITVWTCESHRMTHMFVHNFVGIVQHHYSCWPNLCSYVEVFYLLNFATIVGQSWFTALCAKSAPTYVCRYRALKFI